VRGKRNGGICTGGGRPRTSRHPIPEGGCGCSMQRVQSAIRFTKNNFKEFKGGVGGDNKTRYTVQTERL